MFKTLTVLMLVLIGACEPNGGRTVGSGTERAGAIEKGPDQTSEPAEPSTVDRSLAAYRVELLDVAFEAVTKMPLNPHIKNRSRGQQQVVEACLELAQPQRALGYAKQIANWRRGLCLAKYAEYQAAQGQTENLSEILTRAEQVAAGADQDWRRQRVLVAVAAARRQLGQHHKADQLADQVDEPSELGKLTVTGPGADDEAAVYARQTRDLAALAGSDRIETLENTLHGYMGLYRRHYGNAERREDLADRIRTVSGRAPNDLGLEMLFGLTEAALDHGDRSEAMARVEELQEAVDGLAFRPEYEVPMRSRLAALRHRAGDTDRAREDLAAVLELYDAKRQKILSIDRAGVLRSVAEAYRAMDDPSAAVAIYRRAVEEGVVNPNSRPRALDLCETCLSLAVHGVKPDAAMWQRLRQINEGLGHPW